MEGEDEGAGGSKRDSGRNGGALEPPQTGERCVFRVTHGISAANRALSIDFAGRRCDPEKARDQKRRSQMMGVYIIISLGRFWAVFGPEIY